MTEKDAIYKIATTMFPGEELSPDELWPKLAGEFARLRVIVQREGRPGAAVIDEIIRLYRSLEDGLGRVKESRYKMERELIEARAKSSAYRDALLLVVSHGRRDHEDIPF